MKVSREQAAENRARIVGAAARLFRERGYDGIGIAELMHDAGLTHGGFYGHFESKQDLMAQACEHALAGSLAYWTQLIERDREHALQRIAAAYLSTAHRDQPGRGCTFAALGADAARLDPPVRRSLGQALRSYLELLTPLLPGRSRAARRQRALTALASMVGALVLARAVDDPALSEEVLHAVSAAVSSR